MGRPIQTGDPMTLKQRRIWEFIKSFRTKHGYSPSLDEIADHFGVMRNAVNQQLFAMEKRGRIKRIPTISRSLVPL